MSSSNIVVLPRGYVGKRAPETWTLQKVLENMELALKSTSHHHLCTEGSSSANPKRARLHAGCLGCMVEYLKDDPIVMMFYDWDEKCEGLTPLSDIESKTELNTTLISLKKKQANALVKLIAAMKKAHPDVSEADFALAARSGWKVVLRKSLSTSGSWVVSLRCFVQGKMMRLSDIAKHINAVFGDDCSELDRSVYKLTEQCLALVGGHKTSTDQRVLIPLTHFDNLAAFVVQDTTGCILMECAQLDSIPTQPVIPVIQGGVKRRKVDTPLVPTVQPIVSRWLQDQFEIDSSMVKLDKITQKNSVFIIPTSSRLCPFTKREHANNHVYFTLTLTKDRVNVYLKCHDSECAKNSRSADVIPLEVEREIRQLTQQGSSSSTEVTPDMKKAAVVRTLTEVQKKHPKMDCTVEDSDVLQPTSLGSGGFLTPLKNNYWCPIHDRLHDDCLNCILMTSTNSQIVCKQDMSILALPVDKAQFNVIFANTNIINVCGADSNETRDFAAFEDFPRLFDNRDVDYLCYKSLSGTTMSFAKFAAELIKGRFIFQDNKWLTFEEKKWIECPGPDTYIAGDFVDIYRGLQSTYATEKQIRWLNAQINDLSNLSKRKQFTEELEKYTVYQMHGERIPLDGDEHLVGFQNGVFDARECRFRSHRPEDYLTVLLPYALPETSHENVRADIHRTLESIIPNPDVRNYILLLLALHLEGSNKHAIGMIWTGSGGNGKGVLKDLMRVTFAGLHSEPPATFLTSERPSPEKPAPHLVDLRIKRSVFTSEPEAGKRANSAFIKFITGGDPVSCRSCHSNEIIEYVPRFLVTLLCNMIPLFQGGEDEIRALWRRLKIFHFPTEFVDELEPGKTNQQLKDPYIREKLAGWGPEFMLMLTEIYHIYVRTGRKLPKAPDEVERNLEEQKVENNPVLGFMRNYLTPKSADDNDDNNDDNRSHAVHMHRVYKQYCLYLEQIKGGNFKPETIANFTKRLISMGCTVTDDRKKRRTCCDVSCRELVGWTLKED